MVDGRCISNTKLGKFQHSIRIKTRRKYSIEDISKYCAMCGRTDCLIIHHIRYSTNINTKDLMVLCGKCHSELHYRQLTKGTLSFSNKNNE